MAALKAQGVSRDTLPYKAPFQPYGAWIALFFTFLITFFKVRFVLDFASLASPHLPLLSPADAFVSALGLCLHREVEHGQLYHVGPITCLLTRGSLTSAPLARILARRSSCVCGR